jgi:hypothetical protein
MSSVCVFVPQISIYANIYLFISRLTLRMDAAVASRICAIRSCMNALLVRVCESPDKIHDNELISIVRQLSRHDVWQRDLYMTRDKGFVVACVRFVNIFVYMF